MGTTMAHLYILLTIVVVVVLVSDSDGVVTRPQSSCGSYSYQYGQFCYGFVKERKTWTDAQMTCRAHGGHLAEILTPEHNAYVESIIFEHHEVEDVWLGATDLMQEGQWFWADSDIPVDQGFTYWLPGEPNSYHGHQ